MGERETRLLLDPRARFTLSWAVLNRVIVEATLFMYSLSAHCLLRHVNCLGPDKVRFNLIPNVVLVIALVF